MPPIEFRGTQMVTGSLSSQLVPLCVCISSHEGACHDFLVILAMPTTCAHGTGVAIPLHSSYHTAITFEPLCSHIKPEGLTSSPLRGPTQWLVYNACWSYMVDMQRTPIVPLAQHKSTTWPNTMVGSSPASMGTRVRARHYVAGSSLA